jgi:hypothetical protein
VIGGSHKFDSIYCNSYIVIGSDYLVPDDCVEMAAAPMAGIHYKNVLQKAGWALPRPFLYLHFFFTIKKYHCNRISS